MAMNTSIKIKDLKINKDDRGYLFEIIHNYEIDKFGQVYVVQNPTRYTVRAFHKHKRLWDYFCIVKGSAKFVFEEDGEYDEIILSEKTPQLIIVPPEIFHGWMSLEDDTILISTGSEVYNKDNPDEERIPYNAFEDRIGNVWQKKKK